MFDQTIRYKCAGCGYRWSANVWVDIMLPEVLIIVPEHSSPCCGDGKDDYVTTMEDLRSMPRH